MSKKRGLQGQEFAMGGPAKSARNYYYDVTEFDLFCKNTLSTVASDPERDGYFENYIARNPQFLALDYFISKIDPAPEDLSRSVFVEMWFAYYASQYNPSKDQALALLCNIKGFSKRKIIALELVENADYELSDLKEIVHILANMQENELCSVDKNDEIFREFEAKFRIAVAWLERFDYESKNAAIDSFCKEFNFANSKNDLEKVIAGDISCEDILDEYQEKLRKQEGFFQDFEDLVVYEGRPDSVSVNISYASQMANNQKPRTPLK